MDIYKIPLQLVHPDPMNPRKTFDQEGIEELAANIEKQGLLQPITVRPIPQPEIEWQAGCDQEYRIVCGERRFRAMSHLDKHCDTDKFAYIPAIVREMDDAEAFDAMITENLQRTDVDPIEEAFAFGQLIERGNTAEDVALRFGKSIRFVQDRVKLNALIPELMVEIKDGKMPISAGMLISKLDAERQRDFYKHNKENLNKWSAERYVSNLFMTISTAIWSKDEPDFPGITCGKSCRDCDLNTCNHGCLFYEMKADEKNAKCTNRERFTAKTEEYAFHVIEKHAADLVKVGEPLAKGKTVVGVSIPGYYNDREKNTMREIEDKVRALGHEVVNSDEYFDHRVNYNLDDERTQEMLANGTAYLVLDMFSYSALNPSLRAYYIKKDDEQTNCSEAGIPSKVVELMNEYKHESAPVNYTVALATAIGNNAEATINALNETERIAICATMLQNNFQYRHKNGLGTLRDNELLEYVKKNIGTCFNSILRAYLIDFLRACNNPVMCTLESLLPELGKMWAEEDCQKAIKEKDAKHEKKLKALTKKLADLGYTPDGKKIAKPNAQPNTPELLKVYEEQKKKFPDAIIIFRVGDFYELFGHDAATAAVVLGLTLTKRGNIEMCGFPHHALDTYLPKLVRAGKRVNICENLEAPKKK